MSTTICVAILPHPSSAQMTISWDAVSALDLDRYRLYWDFESEGGSDSIYDHSQDVGNSLSRSTEFLAPALEDGNTYFFVVTAIDQAGNESDFSNQISFSFSTGGGETSTSSGGGGTSTSSGGGGTSTSAGGGGTSTSTGGGVTLTSTTGGGGTSTPPLVADFDIISTRDEDEADLNTANTGATLTASLANTLVTLTVSLDGTGSGVVSSDAVGIDCGVDCSAELPIGTLVTLIATPEDRSIFTGWNNVECEGTDSCTFPAEFSGIVTATFLSEGAADRPDLTGIITKFRRKVKSDGDKAVVKVAIENLGTAPVTGPFSTALFVSDDMVWDAADTQVATVVVEERLLPGERVSVKLAPRGLANLVGKFILIVIDANNDVEESAEANNILVRRVEGVPDLRTMVTKFKHKEGPEDDKLVVVLNVRNRGTAAASEFSVALFLSNDATLDQGDEQIAIATVVDGVAPGKKSGVVKLKRKGLPPMAGKFVIVVVDANDEVSEANEGNNTLVLPIAASGTS